MSQLTSQRDNYMKSSQQTDYHNFQNTIAESATRVPLHTGYMPGTTGRDQRGNQEDPFKMEDIQTKRTNEKIYTEYGEVDDENGQPDDSMIGSGLDAPDSILNDGP